MFNINTFRRAEFKRRTKCISVLELKDFFDAGEDPEWEIQNLTAQEIAQTNDAVNRNRNAAAIIEGLMSADQAKIAEAVREQLGIGNAVPDDLAKRLETLVLGSVKPTIDNEIAVKLATVHATVFWNLTNEILGLTGLGHEPGKSTASIGKRKSKTP